MIIYSLKFLDPVILQGEGECNLDILKEIVPSDSFLGLDEDIKECQNFEPFDNCTTRFFYENAKIKCGCLPYSINLSRKVCHKY